MPLYRGFKRIKATRTATAFELRYHGEMEGNLGTDGGAIYLIIDFSESYFELAIFLIFF